jgi:hypothetical protein
VRLCGISGGKSGTEVGFHRVLRFPLPVIIPSTTPYSLIILSSMLHILDIDVIMQTTTTTTTTTKTTRHNSAEVHNKMNAEKLKPRIVVANEMTTSEYSNVLPSRYLYIKRKF